MAMSIGHCILTSTETFIYPRRRFYISHDSIGYWLCNRAYIGSIFRSGRGFASGVKLRSRSETRV